MKKELFAALTIVLLTAASVINILHIKKLIENIGVTVEHASAACLAEDFSSANTELNTALQTWLDADDYTHIFIRHSEIDTTTDAFYEALEAVLCEDRESASAALGKLSYHLQSILTMEYVTLRSVF